MLVLTDVIWLKRSTLVVAQVLARPVALDVGGDGRSARRRVPPDDRGARDAILGIGRARRRSGRPRLERAALLRASKKSLVSLSPGELAFTRLGAELRIVHMSIKLSTDCS